MRRPFASVAVSSAGISDDTRSRFMAKVEKHDGDCSCCEGCWHWTGARTAQDYGQFRLPGVGTTTAQRAAYLIQIGDLEARLTIDHLCRNRSCVNPAHLEAVPHRINILRGDGVAARHARKKRCIRGHPLVQGKTQRYCPVCKRDKGRLWMRQYRARLQLEGKVV